MDIGREFDLWRSTGLQMDLSDSSSPQLNFGFAQNRKWALELLKFRRPFFRLKMFHSPAPTMTLPRRIFWAALALVTVVFALVWWQWAASSRLATEDFCALQPVRKHGQLGAILWWRQNWAGRWHSQGIIRLFVAELWQRAGLQS